MSKARGGGRGKVAGMPIQLEVLVMGCQGSGKSLLVRRMKQICNKRVPDDVLDTQPTLGVELDDLVFEGASLKIREVGGSFVQVWPNFFDDCGAWAFVIDTSDPLLLPTAAVELWTVLKNPKMCSKKCLLVLHKTDAPMTIPDPVIEEVLRLKELRMERAITVCRASSHVPEGISEVMSFFADAAKGVRGT